MVKEVNPRIHVNERDYPVDGHHCSDPEKAKLVKKLALLITDNIPRKLPGGMKENHMDFWILDRLLTKDEIRFMLSFEKRRVGRTTKWLAEKNGISEEAAQKVIDHLVWIGIVEQNRDNPDQHIQYCIPKWVVGSGEYMVEHKTLPDEHPEVATMFNLAPQEPLEMAGRHRHARDPRGEGHRRVQPERQRGASLPLASEVRHLLHHGLRLPQGPAHPGRGRRRHRGLHVHRRGRHRGVLGGVRQGRPLHHPGGGHGDHRAGGAQGLRPPDHQSGRTEPHRGHLQLLPRQLLRP